MQDKETIYIFKYCGHGGHPPSPTFEEMPERGEKGKNKTERKLEIKHYR